MTHVEVNAVRPIGFITLFWNSNSREDVKERNKAYQRSVLGTFLVSWWQPKKIQESLTSANNMPYVVCNMKYNSI